jgi:hypothetical protein
LIFSPKETPFSYGRNPFPKYYNQPQRIFQPLLNSPIAPNPTIEMSDWVANPTKNTHLDPFAQFVLMPTKNNLFFELIHY